MAESIANMRVYTLARSLEDQVFQNLTSLPADKAYPLGHNLRRGSSAVAHYINQAHERYSYKQKIEMLHQARQASETMDKYLAEAGWNTQLKTEYVNVVKQLWGLIKWLNQRLAEKEAAGQVKASDELVTARG